MAAGNNGDSYQNQRQYDGATGVYQEIPNGSASRGGYSNKKKWMVGISLFALLAIVYGVITMRANPEEAIKKVLADKSSVKVKDTGKLRLFDEFSKLLFCR